MMRLLTGSPAIGLMLAFCPPRSASAASNTATTLIPLDGPNQLETHMFLNCFKSDGHCDFTAGADIRTPDGVTGFPHDLWARQTTEIRSSNRLAYLDAHANGQYERVMKSMGPTRSPPSTSLKVRRTSTRRPAASTPPIGRRASPRPTPTSSPAPTFRWSTPGSTSPRPAPARRRSSPSASRLRSGLWLPRNHSHSGNLAAKRLLAGQPKQPFGGHGEQDLLGPPRDRQAPGVQKVEHGASLSARRSTRPPPSATSMVNSASACR